MRSLEPGEDWSWCFINEVAMVMPGRTREATHPTLPAALSVFRP